MPLTAEELPRGTLASRLFKGRVGWMLLRNTVVSCGTFLVGLGVLWALVEQVGMEKIPAAACSFIVATTLHYIFGRVWIFRGTERALASGFALFLVNALSGLAITTGLFALLVTYTPINYLVARVLVSVFAGLAMFVLNAVWNFRRV